MKQHNVLSKQSENFSINNRLPTTQQTQQQETLQQILNALNNMDQRLNRLELKCEQNTKELKNISVDNAEIKQCLHNVMNKMSSSSSTTFVEDADMNTRAANRTLEELKKSILNDVKLENLWSREFKSILNFCR